MKEFFRKYGKETIFAMIIIVCLGFFVNILAVGKDYSRGVEAQAVERAQFYSSEQVARVNADITLLKNEADFFAKKLSECVSEADEEQLIRSARAYYIPRNNKFVDLVVYADGKAYDSQLFPITSPDSEITAAGEKTGTILSPVFQYDGSIMAVAVSADVNALTIDRFAFVYDRAIISLDSLGKFDASAPEFVSKPEYVLLLKHDGRVIDSRSVTAVPGIGPEPIQSGFLKRTVTDQSVYDPLSAAVSAGVKYGAAATINGEKHVFTVTPTASDEARITILSAYRIESVYGVGYNTVETIWGSLIVFFALLAALSLIVVIGRVRTNRKIFELAAFDQKLKCPTMMKFKRDISGVLSRNKTTQFASIIAKIRNFTYVNERYGEEIADALLVHAEKIYRNALLTGETYAYHEEGEFALLLHYKDRKALTARLEEIYRRVAAFDGIDPGEYKIVVSFNIYEIDRAAKETPTMIVDKTYVVRNWAADISGAVSYNYYSDLIKKGHVRKAEIEGKMDAALRDSEFHLFYQPKFNIANKCVDGSEVLVRWFDPQIDKYRAPAEFLPVFEENGFIDKLDRFVFFKACENIAARVKARKVVYPVSVNVSRVTATRPDFLEYYARIKNKFGVKNGFVTLEFTESFAYENYEYLSETVAKLHEYGFNCSLDDFGTGYSSYNVLKVIDMDEIKLDKFFIGTGISAERDQMILESVIGVVKKMGVKVTQEGVETKADFERLAALGCDVIQGFYFAKPMKYADYCEFIDSTAE